MLSKKEISINHRGMALWPSCHLRSGIKLNRPMTHDLLKNTIESLGAKIEHVVVADLRENTYFASICIDRDGEKTEIDSRPSDAIAVAMRSNAKIFCESVVFEQAHLSKQEWEARKAGAAVGAKNNIEQEGDDEELLSGPKPIVEDGSKSLKELLEDLDPEDFGKYKM